MSSKTMDELLKKQEEEKMDLAAGVYVNWQSIRKNEKDHLGSSTYENAPEHIREKIDKEREAFFSEWGSEGSLAALMAERHEKDREKIVLQQTLLNSLDKSRSKDKGHDR